MSNWTDPERAREYFRQYRAARKAAGLCKDCGRPLEPERREAGRTCCDACTRRTLEAQRADPQRWAKQRARRAKARAEGVCQNCLCRVATPHRTTCLICAARNRLDREGREARREAAGLCIKCAGPKEPGRTTRQCEACTRRSVEYNARRRPRPAAPGAEAAGAEVEERREEVRRTRQATTWLSRRW